MEVIKPSKPGLFTAVGIGVGCMIGSGWLFAAYYAAQYIGPASYISWFIGAGLALILALLLAEIAGMYKQKALFARLLTISHDNLDFGFVIGISCWLGMVIVIPAEAAATIQYLSSAVPSFTPYIFQNHQHTFLGSCLIVFLVAIYTLINYWGIKGLARASNIIAVLKFVIPILTAINLMAASFNGDNFSSQGFAPYGYEKVFSAVVVCGIFYAFYGFSMIAMYSSELENPKKNIPRALILSVLLSLIIYLMLQTAFIAALPTSIVAKGWHNINFTSPLAQLLLLLNINFLSMWSVVLYADSAISPSGTGILYMGSSSRTLTGMARDKQLPSFFDSIHPIHGVSRRSLLFTTLVCSVSVFIFKNWQEIMIVVTVFQLISCVAIPVAFSALRLNKPEVKREYRVKFGLSLSYFIYMVVSYLLTQATVMALFLALFLHIIFFFIYAFTSYDKSMRKIIAAFLSCWSLFAYMLIALFFGYVNQQGVLNNKYALLLFILSFSFCFYALLKQKKYHLK